MIFFIKNVDTILILSGEGEQGTFYEYAGKRTLRALKSCLTKGRCSGDRWAIAFMSTPTTDVYIELDGDLEPCGYRTIVESLIS